MSEGLLNVLDEQSAMSFTGKINVLKKENSQSHAVIYMLDGRIVDCRASARPGEKAILDVIFADVSNTLVFKIVVEPELVSSEQRHFDWSVEDLKKRSRKVYDNYLESRKLRPPQNLKLVLNADFILKGAEVEPSEFDVLSTISDYSRVQEIYNNCSLLEYEVTRALVSLRRKGAIKVVAS